ncbi:MULTISPECIES: hypothetical protein [Burkholderiaceae]|uniref:hypothetical protein n=2 Tax=Burkholderiales TaxID=80840 RepID=UPI001F04EC38|nr:MULTISPECIES: hypothetical protein [Burkholderiaceae]
MNAWYGRHVLFVNSEKYRYTQTNGDAQNPCASKQHSQITSTAEVDEMTQRLRATVIFYNEETQQLQLCTVYRDEIQGAIDRQIARGSAMNVPLGSDDPTAPLTDETLRQIGGMAVLNQASVHPELRGRLQVSLEHPVDWAPGKPPIG